MQRKIAKWQGAIKCFMYHADIKQVTSDNINAVNAHPTGTVAKVILQCGYGRVALQFPDALLHHAHTAVTELRTVLSKEQRQVMSMICCPG